MRERVRLVAGELDIESAPGQGTTILVWVPLKKAEG
jgi:signal transduction histidine kinase